LVSPATQLGLAAGRLGDFVLAPPRLDERGREGQEDKGNKKRSNRCASRKAAPQSGLGRDAEMDRGEVEVG